MAKQNSKTDEEETRKMKKGTKNIADILTKDDIDLIDKLDNMHESEISEEIYEKCNEPEFFSKIEEEVWNLMKDPEEKFHNSDFYEGLEGEYEAADEHDLWSARLYNCDLIYMVAIANVLGLQRPKDSCDIKIFGM